VVDDYIDTEQMVRDVVLLGLPLARCARRTAGLCPECGERWAELAPDHSHETLDARWAPCGVDSRPLPTPKRTLTSVGDRTEIPGEIVVAVPKRRMSRSNTRSRRAQWKTSAPTLAPCSNRACRQLKPPHLAARTAASMTAVQSSARPDRLEIPPARGDRATRGPESDRSALLAQLGIHLDTELLTLALTHRSYAYEHGGLRPMSAWSSSGTRCSA